MSVAEQAPHAPLPRQTGAVDGQSVLAAHATQVFEALQVGFVPEQFALTRQPTHTRGDAVVRQ